MNIRKITYAVFLVLMLFAMPIKAYADTITIESQGITVTTKETPTETVVIDKMEVLSDGQIQAIKDAGTKLSIYNVGLYVEMTEKATSSQEYAKSLAEQRFNELLPAENSVMIVFSFYEKAGAYYGMYYNVQGDLQENRIRRIIDGTYHEFKSDSTWIAGSFEQVVDYLTEVEYNLIHADEIAEQRHAAMLTFGKISRAMLECFAIVAIIYLVWEMKTREKAYKEQLGKRNKEIDSLGEELEQRDGKINELKTACGDLLTWREDAIKSTPELEARIEKFRAKKRARQFDETYQNAEGFDTISRMISEFDAMSELTKSFVKLNIEEARQKLETLTKEAAERASKKIEDACKQPADRHHRDSYDNAMTYYNGLPPAIKILIAAHLISRLNNNHSAAQKDYKRHRNMSSSSSSMMSRSYQSTGSHHHSNGFHSGSFGGHCSGGH